MDHYLMEWMLAMVLKEKGVIKAIIPVFESEVLYGSKKRGIMSKMDVISAATSEKCIAMLKHLQVWSDADERRIRAMRVSEVYETLCRHQAINMESYRKNITGRYTDWKLYVNCARKIAKEAEPYMSVKEETGGVIAGAAGVAQSVVGNGDDDDPVAKAINKIGRAKPLKRYTIDDVCVLFAAALPLLDVNDVKKNGMSGEMLVDISDEDLKDCLKLNGFQLKVIRKTMDKVVKS